MKPQSKAILKSTQAMLRGGECWTCSKAISTKGTNGLGPRYCGTCLKKKWKSHRRKKQLRVVMKRQTPWSQPKPVFED